LGNRVARHKIGKAGTGTFRTWTLWIVEVVVGEKMKTGCERLDFEARRMGVNHIRRGGISDEEIKGIVGRGWLRSDKCKGLVDGRVFERV
jgi:hypothetical protein